MCLSYRDFPGLGLQENLGRNLPGGRRDALACGNRLGWVQIRRYAILINEQRDNALISVYVLLNEQGYNILVGRRCIFAFHHCGLVCLIDLKRGVLGNLVGWVVQNHMFSNKNATQSIRVNHMCIFSDWMFGLVNQKRGAPSGKSGSAKNSGSAVIQRGYATSLFY